ncbi:bifunctional diaminohydroxyphosphoribosylaminopyrimidine deaminase/5-amino-6-(5-phosphoribosylamino)uracil reductase RibD [Cyclobacterium marinum]|uniref:bifunctional diaminohydroxyphosphoribosylaminopyrimidine deaminase/5-amino-6-(5-phosphoribosylamino)uracil reductase RibD n=1 Tax=Cyclobacterium marinum TaxID=104 RepID=UPI0011EFB8D9|nr:bifunctional diaminohydroxyphosphoribosylaminopyrimidine deaminase/5-amino-6-(5-phosphoribosylamino)uracil reductase RibD [Cyclobacterium marinum]MBI0400684.1 bifunctional diaminohydroxyphosphoribosylaminopyrimidine deaminase/5-amino-6-(5-phosphoribosylamino)uracil reductase RibD [Cyclobacterium marinum]
MAKVNTESVHIKYMQRAIELAELGRGSVSPNPMVGCVIVHNGLIIGEGYHQKYGEAHAEVNAIASVKDKSLLKEATLYVSLEPCVHFGKTPPCADLIVKYQLKEVIIAAVDSNPLVEKKGIQKLEQAGIGVTTGILEQEVRNQNVRFFTQMEKKRPYIILKWAQTKDGFVARTNFDSKWISNSLSRQQVHRWRTEEDAILVGTNTARYDNPRLNARDWHGKDPLRLVVDRELKLEESLHLFDGKQDTIIYNHQLNKTIGKTEWAKMDVSIDAKAIVADLYARNIQSLIVEGGAAVLGDFIANDLWDEARVFTGNAKFGLGIPAPIMTTIPTAQYTFKEDLLAIYRNHD